MRYYRFIRAFGNKGLSKTAWLSQHLKLRDERLKQLILRRKGEVARKGLRRGRTATNPTDEHTPAVLSDLVGV